MKAVWYEEFGAAEDVLQFGDFKTPEPKAGQVKIRVHASGVNPSDTKKRLGANPKLLAAGPVIPNSDGAGEIVVVGSASSELASDVAAVWIDGELNYLVDKNTKYSLARSIYIE